MISPDERARLAEIVCARMVARDPDDVIVAGVFGSTALGTSTPWSDLELLFVLKTGSRIQKEGFTYREIRVSIKVTTQDQLETKLTNSPGRWPYYMNLLSHFKTLHGQPKKVDTWLELGRSMHAETIRDWVEKNIESLLTEPYGRIFSCRERRDTRNVGIALWELLEGMLDVLCLLNKRWARHHYLGLTDAFSFPKLPEGFAHIVPILTSSDDVDEIASLTEILVLNFRRLLDDEGFRRPRVYQSLSELPL